MDSSVCALMRMFPGFSFMFSTEGSARICATRLSAKVSMQADSAPCTVTLTVQLCQIETLHRARIFSSHLWYWMNVSLSVYLTSVVCTCMTRCQRSSLVI